MIPARRRCVTGYPVVWLVAMAMLLFVVATAGAQGTGRSLDIDLSIRSSGMGGASGAVFWGGDPNHWATPALLGYHRGVAYTWGRTQLVPGLASDVILESKRYTLGFGGVGLAFAGKGPGSVRLDYGWSEGVDQNGNPTGLFNSYEKIDSWGVGFSLAEAISSWAALGGRPAPAIARHADVAVGFASKDVDIALAPVTMSGTASGTGLDYGVLLRASPLVTPAGAELPLRLDLAYGYSVQNFNDEQLTFLNEDESSPLTRMHRNGVAGRFAMGPPARLRSGASPALAWLLDSLDPLISVGMARDWEHNSAGGQAYFYDVERFGVEVAVANVFTWRTGHVTDRVGGIDGGTSGWGLGFHIGRLAGFRYDRATIPQASDSGLPDVERKGYTVFVDLVTLFERDGPARD